MEKRKINTKQDYRQRVDRVVMYIREHLDEEIDMRTLSELSAFSPFHLHRIMRAYLGEPIGAFIVRTRVEMAATLLQYSDMPISDIAYRVGYETPSSLTKSFGKQFKVSPKVYRQINGYGGMPARVPQGGGRITHFKVVEQEPQQAFYVAALGDYDGVDFDAIFLRLFEEAKRQQLPTEGMSYLALFYDNPDVTAEDNLKCDVCLSIHHSAQPNGEIGVKTIGGGRFAQFLYVGDYLQIGAVYDHIYGCLLPEAGLLVRGNFCYEKYVSDPFRTAPEQLRTEIYIPIE